MSRSFKYVCLGGGNSAGYFAKELVASGLQPGELAIISEEPVVAYERPALSKAYLFPTGAARLPGFHTCVGGGGERQDSTWYESKGITYLTSSKVVSVDVSSKSLTTASGDVINWQDALVVATGANAVRLSDFGVPGADLSGVHYLRNVADADSLLQGLEAAKAAGGKVVVVGGGYIGLEVAAGLSLHGVEVTMVFPETHLMARLFTPELAAFYEAFYVAKGIKLLKGVTAKELKGDISGKVSSVSLSDGSSLPANLVLVGAGARPASTLVKGQVETDKAGGILVDGNFQTNVPGVYAIGDVASFPLLFAGGASVRQEHVTHARSSAAQAAQAIRGANPTPYDYTPYFYSREFSLSWQFYGSSEGADAVITWGHATPATAAAAAAAAGAGGDQAPKFGAYWIKGGAVVGAFVEGASGEEGTALKAVVRARAAAPSAAVLGSEGVAWAVAASSKL